MKPLATLFVATYNQQEFVEDMMKGVLTQDYENLEIIVSDDCSTDKTYERIREIASKYSGPHKLIINRHEKNLGIAGNLMWLINHSNGVYLLAQGGDDISEPYRCSKSIEKFEAVNVATMCFATTTIDADGNMKGPANMGTGTVSVYTMDDYLTGKYKTNGAARIFKKDIFNVFGPLNSDCPTEDSTINFRAFLIGGIAYCDMPMLKYRVHGNNISLGDNYIKMIDPHKIYLQYTKDLDTALQKNIIDAARYLQIKKHLDHYLSFQKALRDIYQKNNVFTKTFAACRYLTYKNLSIKDVYSLTALPAIRSKILCLFKM